MYNSANSKKTDQLTATAIFVFDTLKQFSFLTRLKKKTSHVIAGYDM
jgi:hypothetical protein